MDKENFNSEDSFEFEEPKKYIPQARALLQGFSYEPCCPKILFDCKLQGFIAAKGTSKDPCNMNKLDDLLFDHVLLKQQIKNTESDKNDEDNNYNFGTLSDKYKNQVPVYQKFGTKHSKYFASQIVSLKPGRKLPKFNSKRLPSDENISIDSDFQFGNLSKVYKVSEYSYQLVLQNDVNTKGNNQWFFFRVKGVPKNTTIKFEIVNLIKKQSLFSQGMKPTVFSKVRYEKKGIGWVRQGQKVQYYPNSIKKQHRQGFYYSLSFQYKVLNQDDSLYFSHSYPYTFSDLNQYMTKIFSQTYNHLVLSLSTVGDTIAGNRVDVITITGKQPNKSKKIVWVIGRQHPGQITSSFVVEGIINALLEQNQLIEYLRDNVVFKIVPMLNPDGVIHGNSRCQLIGSDPNRRWKLPSKGLNPIIYSLKQIITRNSTNKVDLVLDLHSHSRKFGTFFYGNSGKQKQKSRVYPLIVCQNNPKFSFASSRFSEGPKSTARYTLHKMLGISNVFTVESSFYGYQQNNRIIQYLPNDFRDLGKQLLQGYAMMLDQQCPRIEKLTYSSAMQKLHEQPELIKQGDKQSIGSDSDPSGDQLQEKQLQKILPKKLEIIKKKKKKNIKKKTQTKQLKPKQQPKIQFKQSPRKQSAPPIRKKSSSFFPINRKYSTSYRKQFIRTQQPILLPSKSVQTQQIPIFKPVNRSSMQHSGKLIIVGQKVQDRQIWLEGNNTIGIQSSIPPIFTTTKSQFKRPNRMFRLISDFKENRGCIRDCSKKY